MWRGLFATAFCGALALALLAHAQLPPCYVSHTIGSREFVWTCTPTPGVPRPTATATPPLQPSPTPTPTSTGATPTPVVTPTGTPTPTPTLGGVLAERVWSEKVQYVRRDGTLVEEYIQLGSIVKVGSALLPVPTPKP